MRTGSVIQHTYLLLCFVCSAIATTTPLFDHQIDELIESDEEAFETHLRRRQSQSTSGSFAITGVQNAGVQPRLEIRELAERPDMFNVFLLGLARYQAMPQDEHLSYYDTCSPLRC